MRSARAKVEGHAFYHVTNRILERRFILKDGVAERFRLLMRRVEAFTGVRVVTYCLMTNHVHLLLEVPHRTALSDAELLARLKGIASPAVFAGFLQRWNRMREQGSESGLEELRAGVRARMFDVSAFMKELKLRFTMWYNRLHQRRGTLWEERFRSTLVQGDGNYLATAAAYIDLNPVRAGLVRDPKDHRFCGYAEALAGGRAAQRGLARALSADGCDGVPSFRSTEALLARYRQRLLGRSAETARRGGAPAAGAQGQPGAWELARHRLRWLSDGLVVGSRAFVEEMRARLREKLGLKRARGAYAAPENPDFRMLRALRRS